MTFPERNVHVMLVDLTTIRTRIHEFIPIRKLATLHKLEQMLRVRMLEQQSTWKSENDVDRTEIIIAERHERTLRRLYVSYDSNPFLIGASYNRTLTAVLL